MKFIGWDISQILDEIFSGLLTCPIYGDGYQENCACANDEHVWNVAFYGRWLIDNGIVAYAGIAGALALECIGDKDHFGKIS